MAYNYLKEDDLADALADSEDYMRSYYEPIPELQRLTRGQPGKVPKGKPRVTDGTLAGIRRETPKQIIQQLPTGFSMIHNNDALQNQVNGILKDVILPNANSGGTPYAKAKRAIRSTIDVGSAWAVCFFNRTGTILHADYKLKNYRDVLFEKGKSSEFDSNFMPIVDWLTEGDINAIIYMQEQRQYTETDWDLDALKEMLEHGPSEKDEAAKTPAEKKANNTNGYFKLVYFFQKGVDATFYCWAPNIKKCVRKWQTKDPRGIIPVHGLVPEDDDDNPLGEPLAAISAGKQNLLDFDMQMYQYGQALQYSPPTKKWGQTDNAKIKLIPDNVIEMDGSPATDDIKVVDLANSATQNFGNNYGLIKTQIQAEMGRRNDSSVSATSGNPDFSKTSAGVKQSQAVTDVSNNDLMQTYELWQARVWETCLNLQFAYSTGKKEVEFTKDTIKRYKLEDNTTVDYDQKVGPISFKIEASSSRATDSDTENQKLISLLEVKAKYLNPDDKVMLMYNQIVRNTGVSDPEKLLYTDEEILQAAEMRKQQTELARQAMLAQGQAAIQAAQSQGRPATQPKTLGESVSWKPGDLKPGERAQALAQVGIQADENPGPTPNEAAQAIDSATKVDKHVHDTTLELSEHAMQHALPTPTPEMAPNGAGNPQPAEAAVNA